MPSFPKAFLVGAAILTAGFAEPALAGPIDAACRSVTHFGQDYIVCSFDPAASDIRLYNKDQAGVPFKSFKALSLELHHHDEYLVFAMNGGMYHEDLSPVGLHVEEGVEQAPLNTNSGWGNFHLLPNGVFYVGDGKARVMAAEAYRAAGIKPRFATQSGPVLVIDGALHPRFLPNSDSFKTRNGVGVTTSGEVVFAVSKRPVRFHDFATLFRDALGCPNALFLDGTISSLYAPEINRHDRLFPLGPIIAVVASFPQ
ncbi:MULTISPECIES: phosphodiester glycosidase family protein [unclassified Sinorhizobium]|uniref:phosphodiester glycosidase family protein n=1 Tax=unclassified Sinorhizobium TaxID=2613772 RepID=UPI0024C23982|nr:MULTISPECIES: phosphodiester glycosidase family protein [unclassified Sinorhizobium]MDK1373251.1 phosphodiester glycosidase family protein [Sinorhizobium sp. 6-70]MDK1482615.1 phosphodiester glycosidase family protein [Sinorhizobium sp. 6-117]